MGSLADGRSGALGSAVRDSVAALGVATPLSSARRRCRSAAARPAAPLRWEGSKKGGRVFALGGAESGGVGAGWGESEELAACGGVPGAEASAALSFGDSGPAPGALAGAAPLSPGDWVAVPGALAGSGWALGLGSSPRSVVAALSLALGLGASPRSAAGAELDAAPSRGRELSPGAGAA